MEYKEKCLILDIFFVMIFTIMWICAVGIYIMCKEMGVLNPIFDLFGQHKFEWFHNVVLIAGILIYSFAVIYCLFVNKNLKIYVISAAVSLVFFLLVFIITVCSYLRFSKFSPESWQENIRERYIMISDLEKNYEIIGMDRKNVDAVLGLYDDIQGENRNYIYEYETGYIVIFFSEDIAKSIQIFDASYEKNDN